MKPHLSHAKLFATGLLLLCATWASGAGIEGTVTNVTGNTATVAFDGSAAAPKSGDEVEIFFKITGIDEEISVATGKVASVNGGTAEVTVEGSSGTVMKDHLVRIKPAAKTAPASTPAVAGTPGSSSAIVGDWVAILPEGGPTTVSFAFKEDGSLLWLMEDEQSGQTTRGKYRLDLSTQPQGIELFALEQGDMKGEKVRGIFELQSDGRLKLDFPKEQQEQSRMEFTKDALVFSKATSPVVPSTKPAPTPYQPPARPRDEELVTEAIARRDRGDAAGAMEAAEQAIAFNPKNASAYFWRGICHSGKKDWAAAVADFEKAMELDPGMKLEDLIAKTKAVEATPAPATPTASPTRTRAKKR